ncbi:MAG: zinc-ribbon domain containing protein [Dehalococcoidales bacterium]|nr:zinc-ribbon domain containing protein [Dehalococcoidales bacterium]
MNEAFSEKILTCADCGQDFIFTEGEQRYFWSKGLAEPKRCKPCRMIRRRSIVSIKVENNEHNRTR